MYLDFPDGSLDKESACDRGEGDPALIPGLGRSPRERNGNPFQYSHLDIPSTEEPGGLHSIESQGFRHD